MIAVLLWLATLAPEPASRVAAVAMGRPDIAPLVVAVTRRESRGERVGPHAVDAHLSDSSLRKAVRTGWLPRHCRKTWPGLWATWGPQGLNAALNAKYLPPIGWLCLPHAFAVPIVSAIASVRKAAKVCRRRKPDSWCPGTPSR